MPYWRLKMAETKFFGARIEPKELGILDKVAKEENIDKTSAMKILINKGWKEIRLEKAIKEYRDGKISIDKAAKIAGLTVHEMMEEAAAKGIKTEESIDDLRKGLRLLLSS